MMNNITSKTLSVFLTLFFTILLFIVVSAAETIDASSSSSTSTSSSSSSTSSYSSGSGSGASSSTSGSSSSSWSDSYWGSDSSWGSDDSWYEDDSYYEEDWDTDYAFSEEFTTIWDYIGNLSEIVGNIYQPVGFSTGCSSTIIGNESETCLTKLRWCSESAAAVATPEMIDNYECPNEGLTSCMKQYASCLLSFTAEAVAVNTSVCAWTEAMVAEVLATTETSFASWDCYIFSYFLTDLWFHQCIPEDFYDSVCNEVATVVATQGARLISALNGISVGQKSGQALPRGMAPLVIRSKGNCSTSSSSSSSSGKTSSATKGCSRAYFDGSCECPNGGVAQSFDAFVPSYLTAAKNDTCKKAPSVFEFCDYDSQWNISFSVSNDTSSSSSSTITTSERYAEELETTTSTSSTTCPKSGQTARNFRILSPDAKNHPVMKTLTVCAEPNTNVFIMGSDTGGCYDPRPNISWCNCDGARNNGFSLVFVNHTTNKSAAGTLVICNFDVSKIITNQQIASSALSALSALASGPAFAYMYLASTVSLIDCGKDTSDTADSGGRRVIIPIRFPVDSPADGLYFALTVIFALLIAQVFAVFVVATHRFINKQGVEKDPESADMIFYSRRKPVYNPEEQKKETTNDTEQKDLEEQASTKNRVSVVRVATPPNEEVSIPPVCSEEQNAETNHHENNDNDGALQKEGTTVFTIHNDDGEVIVLRAPHKIQYKPNPTYWDYFSWQAGKFRLPTLSLIAAKILYQGLSYESMVLMSRFTGSAQAVGAIGFILSVLILAWYCYIGYLAHKLFRTEAYYEYTVGYQPSFSIVRFLGFKGMWNRRYKSVRQDAVFFGNFRGDSEHLWWSVPLPVARALLVSIVAGAPVSESACSFVYYFLAIVLLLTGILQVAVRADRSTIDVVTNAFLNLILALYLLMIVNNAAGLNVVYLIIVYAGSTLALTSIGFMLHEFLLVLPREMGNYIADDSDDEEDGVSDSDDNDDDEEGEEMQNAVFQDDFDESQVVATNVNPLRVRSQDEHEEDDHDVASPRENEDEEHEHEEQNNKQRRREERRQKRLEERERLRQQRIQEREVRRRQKAAQRRDCGGYVNFFASMC